MRTEREVYLRDTGDGCDESKTIDRAIHISHMSQDRKVECTGAAIITRVSYFHGARDTPLCVLLSRIISALSLASFE